MKTRVRHYCGYYYPQSKGWLFWHHIYRGGDIVYFTDKESAIKCLNSKDWLHYDEVVWESK